MARRSHISSSVLAVMVAALFAATCTACGGSSAASPAPTSASPPTSSPAAASSGLAKKIAIDGDSSASVTAPARTPIDVVFHCANSTGCATTIHFTAGNFTKTSANPLTYHSEGLAPGSYSWKCNMLNCHYGKLLVQ
jgi:hypothetical protein